MNKQNNSHIAYHCISNFCCIESCVKGLIQMSCYDFTNHSLLSQNTCCASMRCKFVLHPSFIQLITIETRSNTSEATSCLSITRSSSSSTFHQQGFPTNFMMTRISRLSSILCTLLLLPFQTLAQFSCGIPFVTVDCKSKNDIRYDASIDFDLKTHSEFWKSLPGFYYAKDYRFDYQNNAVTAKKPPLNNDELQALGIDPVTDVLWSQYPQEIFLNITIQGTRMMIHKLTMARDNEGTRPGFINAVDEYYVSSHEKDGIARLIAYRFGMQGTFYFIYMTLIFFLPWPLTLSFCRSLSTVATHYFEKVKVRSDIRHDSYIHS